MYTVHMWWGNSAGVALVLVLDDCQSEILYVYPMFVWISFEC